MFVSIHLSFTNHSILTLEDAILVLSMHPYFASSVYIFLLKLSLQDLAGSFFSIQEPASRSATGAPIDCSEWNSFPSVPYLGSEHKE